MTSPSQIKRFVLVVAKGDLRFTHTVFAKTRPRAEASLKERYDEMWPGAKIQVSLKIPRRPTDARE
jgi:hypothetical protein